MRKITLSVLSGLLLGSTIFAQTVNYSSTGLNQTSTSQPILFKNNGTELMRIGNNGNVGVGTSSPSEKLEVNGNLKVTGTINSTSSSPAVFQNLKISSLSGTGDRFVYVDGNGNLKLSPTPVLPPCNSSSSTPNPWILGGNSEVDNTTNFFGTCTDFDLKLGAHNTNIIWLKTSTANVGIGTSDPGQKLHVNGIGRFGNTSGRVDIGFNSVHGYVDSDQDLLINYYSGKHVSIGRTDHANGPSDLFVSGKLSTGGNISLNDNTIKFRNETDNNHGLGWYKNTGSTNDKVFLTDNSDLGLDGPVLFGNNGGALGSSTSGTHKIALYWNNTGSVGINTLYVPSEYKLAVNGKVIAEEFLVKLRGGWPDYVFNNDYNLKSIEELEMFIKSNKHLPGIASEKELQAANGITLGEMVTKQMEKIEELTLYMIQLNKEVKTLKQENKELKTLLTK